MRLFLVRHGETVDNVAGLYAGSRDSALTAHGVLQARRLASHLAHLGEVKHIFSSDLQRAAKTAEAVVVAQDNGINLVKLSELREKDFGSNEGVKFGPGKADAEETRVDDSETASAMTTRVDRFLEHHLLPVLNLEAQGDSCCVIVAHGIILRVLFRSLCARLPGATTVSAGVRTTGPGPLVPSWSNTGYVEGVVSIASVSSTTPTWSSISLRIQSVNSVEHLKGLKKTRGGIGSAKFDDKQSTLASFFTAASKKRKHTDAA